MRRTHLAGVSLARPGCLLVPLPFRSLGSVSLPLPLPPVLLPLPLPRLPPPSSPAEPPLLAFPLSPLPAHAGHRTLTSTDSTSLDVRHSLQALLCPQVKCAMMTTLK